MKRKRVVSEHYVNNKEFLEALIVFKAKCLAAKEAGEPRPQISNYIGECFLKIATTLVIQTELCQLHVSRGYDM